MPSNADLAILIPLKEEFRELIHEIGLENATTEKGKKGDTFYLFQRNGVSCVAVMSGEPGEMSAGLLTAELLDTFAPNVLVVLGIAGALDDELRVGDVVCSTSVNSYMANSKANEGEESEDYSIATSGEVFRADPRIIKNIRNFEFNSLAAFNTWQVNSKSLLEEEIDKHPAIKSHINDRPRIYEGHVASGPTVSGSARFKAFLKGIDRKFLAVEMESGGVFKAVENAGNPCKTFAIRGISDLSDQSKKTLDNNFDEAAVSNGLFRKYAVRNAIGLLWKLIDTESLEIVTEIYSDAEVPQAAQEIDSLQALVSTLESSFRFGWESHTFDFAESFIVYWPVTLREPTPIHAVQAFAAAALQKFGAKVFLCLDDLGNPGCRPEAFCSSIKRWIDRVGGEYDAIEVRRFQEFMESKLDAWPVMQQWLGKTDERVNSILQISKILDIDSNSAATATALREKRPRRILTPATVWAVLTELLSSIGGNPPVITLGGVDEKQLWKSWRKHIYNSERIGHLYNPKLGSDRPVHMASTNLGWDSLEHILNAFEQSLAGEEGLDANSMIAWTLRGCMSLPEFVESDFSKVNLVRNLGGLGNAKKMSPDWAKEVSKWLFDRVSK